jgi:hypothetical protein
VKLRLRIGPSSATLSAALCQCPAPFGIRKPDDILNGHSPKSVHLTITLAIGLWKEHGLVLGMFKILWDLSQPQRLLKSE